MFQIKLNKLKSIANNALRQSIAAKNYYRIDPFEHYTPEEEIILDLITGRFTPKREGDDIEDYYFKIHEWFHEVLLKEGIPLNIIEKAIINITPEGKTCIIVAKSREFNAFISFK